jgi:putative isomerase
VPYGVNVFESDEPMAKRRMVMPFAIPEEHGDGTHPPVFAQALAALWSRTGDERLMRRLLPNALAYHDWFERRRQSRQLPGLLRVARWSDSGMDNSKRWGPHGSAIRGTGLPEAGWSLPMATVDVNVLSVLEKQCLAGMLEHIGRTDEALELRTHARERTRLIHQHLWDEEHGFYFDREEEAGRFIRVFTPVGLYPLLLDELPHTRFERLARHLLDESKFFTEAPMPSLAADDPDFRAERSYWMGCTWSNYNVFVLRGLLSRKPEYAFRLFDRILDTMIRPEGPMVFENYNPLTGQYYDCPNFTWQMMYFDVILRDMLGVRMEAGVPRARPARVPDAWQYYRVDNLKADGMTWTVHWDAAEGRGHAPALEIRDE